MAVAGCSPGVLATTLVAVLLLPAPYLVPELVDWPSAQPKLISPSPKPVRNLGPISPIAWLERTIQEFPPFDIFATVVLLVIGLAIYLFEMVQRKLMERRLVKLNEYLSTSVAHLRLWDRQQAQLDGTLRMVRRATADYDLLLWLLLRTRTHDKERAYRTHHHDNDVSEH